MELFALQASLTGLIRPEMALQNDLSAVLREGRVLQGEVLQTLDGGSLMIGIGSHRVSARAQVQLELGQRFLFQVETDSGVTYLRILGGSQDADSVLLRALRAVVGQDLPLGALLGELRQTLAAAGLATPGALPPGVSPPGASPAAASPGGALAKLLAQLTQHVFEPGESGLALRDQLQSGGLVFESRLREASLLGLSSAELGRLAGTLSSNFLTALAQSAGTGGPVDPLVLGTELREALLAQLGPQAEPAAIRGLSGRELEALLAQALSRVLSGPGLEAASAVLAKLDLPGTGTGARRILLATLLGWDPGSLFAGAGPAATASSLGALAKDLKARLLRALAEAPEGPERQAVARTLAGLEAEQLFNLARRESREPMHWSLPVPDGERWTTAHLFVRRDSQRNKSGEGADDGQRLTVAVEFSHTGPVRADLALSSDVLAMRIVVSRPEVLELARAALGQLEQALAGGGRRVQLAVALATPESLDVERGLPDIRFLQEHHIMDLRG